jgi:hypothetical protein
LLPEFETPEFPAFMLGPSVHGAFVFYPLNGAIVEVELQGGDHVTAGVAGDAVGPTLTPGVVAVRALVGVVPEPNLPWLVKSVVHQRFVTIVTSTGTLYAFDGTQGTPCAAASLAALLAKGVGSGVGGVPNPMLVAHFVDTVVPLARPVVSVLGKAASGAPGAPTATFPTMIVACTSGPVSMFLDVAKDLQRARRAAEETLEVAKSAQEVSEAAEEEAPGVGCSSKSPALKRALNQVLIQLENVQAVRKALDADMEEVEGRLVSCLRSAAQTPVAPTDAYFWVPDAAARFGRPASMHPLCPLEDGLHRFGRAEVLVGDDGEAWAVAVHDTVQGVVWVLGVGAFAGGYTPLACESLVFALKGAAPNILTAFTPEGIMLWTLPRAGLVHAALTGQLVHPETTPGLVPVPTDTASSLMHKVLAVATGGRGEDLHGVSFPRSCSPSVPMVSHLLDVCGASAPADVAAGCPPSGQRWEAVQQCLLVRNSVTRDVALGERQITAVFMALLKLAGIAREGHLPEDATTAGVLVATKGHTDELKKHKKGDKKGRSRPQNSRGGKQSRGASGVPATGLGAVAEAPASYDTEEVASIQAEMRFIIEQAEAPGNGDARSGGSAGACLPVDADMAAAVDEKAEEGGSSSSPPFPTGAMFCVDASPVLGGTSPSVEVHRVHGVRCDDLYKLGFKGTGIELLTCFSCGVYPAPRVASETPGTSLVMAGVRGNALFVARTNVERPGVGADFRVDGTEAPHWYSGKCILHNVGSLALSPTETPLLLVQAHGSSSVTPVDLSNPDAPLVGKQLPPSMAVGGMAPSAGIGVQRAPHGGLVVTLADSGPLLVTRLDLATSGVA